MENILTTKNYILNNGIKIPIIGLGTAKMENAEEVIYNSIKDGVRLIDTASVYHKEEEVGKAIKKAIQNQIVKREDLFIITKLYTPDKNNPEEAIKLSLKKLELDYVDLYLDHWPQFIQTDKENNIIFKAPMHIVWGKMEDLVEKGLTKSIGVSNYNVQSMSNLLSFCKIKPAVLEIENHPYLYQKNLIDFCKKQNIRIISYNPLVKGPYCKNYHEGKYKDLLESECIKNLAEKYHQTPGQIVLNWSIKLGCIPIPTTSKIDRMKENLGATEFILSDEDFSKICNLNINYRFCGSVLWKEAHSGFDLFA